MDASARIPLSDPWCEVPPRLRRRLFTLLSILVVALSLVLLVIDGDLRTPAAPAGILSYELAGTVERSAAILDSWSPRAREAAMFSNGIDYLYMVTYAMWFSLACAGLARGHRGALASVGFFIAWAVLLAAPLDAVENWGLIVQLRGGADATAAAIARGCAVPKFALVGVAALYVVGAGIARLLGAAPAAR